MEQATIDAIWLNLDGICFTERVDYGVKPDWDHPEGARFKNGRPLTNCAYPACFAELEEMRERYGKVPWCSRGLEFGIQKETIPAYEKLFGAWQDHLDMVLLSVHEIGNLEFWTNEYQEGWAQLEFTCGYHEAVLDCIEHFDSWSVPAHLDLTRYHGHSGEGLLPFESTEDIVAAIRGQPWTRDKHFSPVPRREGAHAVKRHPHALPRPRRHDPHVRIGLHPPEPARRLPEGRRGHGTLARLLLVLHVREPRAAPTAQAGCPRTSHGAGHTLAGLSREEIDAALEELPRAPQPLGTAASASLSGIVRQDLDADMDY